MSSRRLNGALGVAMGIATLGACHERSHDVAPGGAAAVAPRVSASAAKPSATAPPESAALANIAAAASAAATVATAPHELRVPRTPKPIPVSEHFDVATWGPAVNTHTLLDEHGLGAVPVSECRFLWREPQLYVACYAGDLELEAKAKHRDGPVWKDDSFTFAFFGRDDQARLLSVSVAGVIADGVCPKDADSLEDARCDLKWQSGVKKVGVDVDGTLNEPGGHDEEWTIQLAIPLEPLLAEAGRLRFALRRCEVGARGLGSCGRFGTAQQPATLILD